MTDDLRKLLTQKSRKCPSEYDECCDLVDWFKDHDITYVHVPNEGSRSVVVGQQLARIGLHKGFPDYLAFSPPDYLARHGIPGVAIEMKRQFGSKLDDEDQLAWGRKMKALGWLHVMAKGAEEAILFMETYNFGEPVEYDDE